MSAGALARALRLVVIVGEGAADGPGPVDVAAAAVRGGATMLQVRAKSLGAAALADLTRRIIRVAGAVPVIVNDRFDVATLTGASGCHLGQDDFPIAEARRLAPPGFLLGGSAGNEAEARAAAAQGAHYLGIGPVRSTGNKKGAGAVIGVDGFQRVLAAAGLPAVAIGGITVNDVRALMAAGAAGVAVIGAVSGARDPEVAAHELREAVDAR